ncbi:MAG: hypothetical protein KJ990_09755 [Proteobacteria bacterium]|nr:hypothetical protein [Pseudomonadota bacterium]MBU1649247.1 hypothetical protein [Pseudomonadota bacterium]MBU1986067.1 hypothetical protein [Pseudomonadota bacterium]
MNITRKFNIFALLLPLALLLAPNQAWALQVHAPPEGIYIHQLAHLFFAAALSYLFWDVRRSAFPGKGWRYLQIFCVLMILWNILAFSGHWLGFHIDNADIIRSDGYFSSHIIGPISAIKFIYFCATLDHLLSVPALLFLFLCMRSLYRSIDKEEKK